MTQKEIDTRVSQAEILPGKISIAKMPLLAGARGVVVKDTDGYMVIINADLTAEEQEQALIHEIRHIWRGDFENPATADQIEAARHANNLQGVTA